MPYARIDARRKVAREGMAEVRARKGRESVPLALPDVTDPIGELCRWAAETLKIPAGHPLAGEPMAVPEFGEAFLRDAWEARESLLTVGRKNAKSAIIAILLLAHLAGPLAVRGWRGAVASVNKEKAAELKRQMQDIAQASGLTGLRFLRSPAPGRVEGPSGTVDVLSADKNAGAASGFDVVVCDEIGLLAERNRQFISGLKSSTSARNGKFICISIHGDGPFVPEFLARAGDPAIAVHAYIPEEDAPADDPATWAAGNPGLGTIKSTSYMADRARISATNPTDLSFFRSEDCNIPGNPGVTMICSPDEWTKLLRLPEGGRQGPVVLGFDAGGSASMTAAAAIWFETGRMEVFGAFPTYDKFGLRERGAADAVGRRYEELHKAGELWAYPGRRTTPVTPFLVDVANKLAGHEIVVAGADRFRRTEIQDWMTDAGMVWPLEWRGTGASATADGSMDVRAFQRSVLDKWLRPTRPAKLMLHAIAESVIRTDGAGNPALDKGRQAGRIDPLSAAVIAAGLAERQRNKPRRGYRSAIVG